MRLNVHQSLADGALNRAACAFRVIDLERDPVRIAEIELRQIAVQMLLAAMLVHALHAALEGREEAFDRVRMDVAPAVFLGAVVDCLVRGVLLAEALIVGASSVIRRLSRCRLADTTRRTSATFTRSILIERARPLTENA